MCELHNTENKQMLNFCSNTVNHATVYISYHWSAMSIWMQRIRNPQQFNMKNIIMYRGILQQ